MNYSNVNFVWILRIIVGIDGDHQHIGTADELDTIKKNQALLSFFGAIADFPDNLVHEKHLGFLETLNENLGLATSKKGLKLFKHIKQNILTEENVPNWVKQVIEAIDLLHDNTPSILLKQTLA